MSNNTLKTSLLKQFKNMCPFVVADVVSVELVKCCVEPTFQSAHVYQIEYTTPSREKSQKCELEISFKEIPNA